MQAIEAFNLIYSGSGIHELYSANNAHLLKNLTKLDNRKVAEWALDAIEYRFKEQHLQEIMGLSSKATHDYFSKIHADYEQNLRGEHFVQDPVISDEEAADLLFRAQIECELEKMPRKKEITIKCR